jgi:hypothetical protein
MKRHVTAIVVPLMSLGLAVFFQASCGSGNGASAGARACSSGSDGGEDTCQFIGTWPVSSGTIALTCGGQVTTIQVTGDEVWQTGTTSDLLQPAAFGVAGCVLLANVAGDMATALPNQACTTTMGSQTVKLTIATYTFILGSNNGTTATENASGTGTVTVNGTSETCTYTETATYTKS